MTRNSFWTLGCIGDEARGGLGREGHSGVTQGFTLPVAVLGWKVPETTSVVLLFSYTDPADRLEEDSSTSPWAVWLSYRGNYDLYTTWWYNCIFHLFFPFFFQGDRMNAFEQCSCGIIISATAIFKGDVNLTTGKDILEKAMSFIHE